MSSNLSCEMEVFGNVTVGQAQQVVGEFGITIGTLCLHDPTESREAVSSTIGHQVIHASLEALDGLTFSKGKVRLRRDN